MGDVNGVEVNPLNFPAYRKITLRFAISLARGEIPERGVPVTA
jgi:hypothetical protein